MKRKYSLLLIFILMLALFLPFTAAASIWDFLKGPEVPAAAKTIAKEIDKQLSRKYITEDFTKHDLMIIPTVPVSVDNLDVTSPLSRQMSEELTSQFATLGYGLTELRKAKELSIIPQKGEFMLTRELDELALENAHGVAVMTGTYIISTINVRYNVTLIHLPSNEILAKASATVPIRDELMPLLYDDVERPPLMPSVQTKLQ